MIYYDKVTNSFYDSAIHDVIPVGARPVTAARFKEIGEAKALGKRVYGDAEGDPQVGDPPPVPIDKVRQGALTELRTSREPVLNRVVGIASSAMVTGNTVLAEECVVVRQQLLDMTENPAFLAATTYADMRIAIKAEYTRIATAVSSTLRTAFKDIEG